MYTFILFLLKPASDTQNLLSLLIELFLTFRRSVSNINSSDIKHYLYSFTYNVDTTGLRFIPFNYIKGFPWVIGSKIVVGRILVITVFQI